MYAEMSVQLSQPLRQRRREFPAVRVTIEISRLGVGSQIVGDCSGARRIEIIRFDNLSDSIHVGENICARTCDCKDKERGNKRSTHAIYPVLATST